MHTAVSRFLGTTANAGADGGSGAAAPMTPGAHNDQQTFSLNDPVALYELTPEFVTGKTKPTTGNVTRLSYLASRVNDANGHKATVLLSSTAKGGGNSGSWHLMGVRDGDSDLTYGKQTTDRSKVFTEPQIHAWYRLKNGIVEPLNREATSGLQGKRAMTLAAYQKLVHSRYVDKMPGSAYDRKGLAGGYGLASTPPHPSLPPRNSAPRELSRSRWPAAPSRYGAGTAGGPRQVEGTMPNWVFGCEPQPDLAWIPAALLRRTRCRTLIPGYRHAWRGTGSLSPHAIATRPSTHHSAPMLPAADQTHLLNYLASQGC
ncbi:hypothetical protein [Streptomyces sp. CT34]|uniref:hypothetical protein n=1 Tax=Streptomyces sp. CT34 TaxID=1553907 RepID=UPI00068C2DD2|nr:hypothetical protein [Streptomyces sp. CT34]